MSLLPVEEALARLLSATPALSGAEAVPIAEADGRVLADAIGALRDQPPFPTSAMDGYAVRADDLVSGQALTVIGESTAGRRFHGAVAAGTAVRILTGAPLPEGADTILIQENARRDGDRLIPLGAETRGRYVRRRGLDFAAGETFFARGHRLGPRDLALLAAMGHGTVRVRPRPRVALLATGDELVAPGASPGPDQIVASSDVAIAALVNRWGGEPIRLGIAEDTVDAIAGAADRAAAAAADVLVTLGGASVGDRDLIQPALQSRGLVLAFWRIAMRPGKPLMAGRLGATQLLGLPGNPASAIVCAVIFLRPLIETLLGMPAPERDRTRPAITALAIGQNDHRQDYLRAVTTKLSADGTPIVTILPQQDSSMTSTMARADCLVIRAPNAAAVPPGSAVRILPLE